MYGIAATLAAKQYFLVSFDVIVGVLNEMVLEEIVLETNVWKMSCIVIRMAISKRFVFNMIMFITVFAPCSYNVYAHYF